MSTPQDMAQDFERPDIPKPTRVAAGNFEGVLAKLLRNHAEKINDIEEREKLGQYFVTRAGVSVTQTARGFVIDSRLMRLADLPARHSRMGQHSRTRTQEMCYEEA